ncbi:DsbA family oxidoreductase [Aspergillus stella-maris]|uniref:DsbA family oxidoreductase n=1 Tax=Aspergillus stella-maris TaxID=1810926 RepID=UPI003CCD4364
MAVIPIEIISDPICPWCYIGYRSLQRTVALYQKTYPGGSKDELDIIWKPYFIDQVEPTESVLINDRMARRMTASQINGAQTRLTRVGKGLGIGFRFGGYIGSSRVAHRTLHLALERYGGLTQCELADRLFRSQFELEKDVSDVDVVISAAVESGMDETLVKEYLESDRDLNEVEEEARNARGAGVQGVPLFLIGSGETKVRLEGAADMNEFFEAFAKARDSASCA